MTLDRLAELAALTLGYWIVDRLVRRDGVVAALRRLGARSPASHGAVLAVTCAAAAPFYGWRHVPDAGAVAILAGALAAMLTWKAATTDIDPVFGDRHRAARRWLVLAALATLWSPVFLLATVVLLSAPFGVWQHHATLPMRVLLAIVAWLGLVRLTPVEGSFADGAVLAFFVLTVQTSHYFITALAKMWLGPKWWSWIVDNRLHHLAASAYSWGWARFLPWSTWSRVIARVRRAERPFQAFAFGVELIAPLALLHPHLAVALCVAWAGFHLGVFLCSGLLFWEWILTDLAVAGMVLALPETVTNVVFGPWQTLAALVFMAAFPLRHKLWKPIPLGWWDTPFTQRIHWRAHGASGRVYGVYNDFMCPNERLYGKVHACFLAPARGITYHLGEVWKRELRDAIRAAGPDLERLETVRERFGIEPRDPEMARNHVAYLRRFFHAINAGAPKHVLPRRLRWLKAPGDQVYYWGELPAFRGQEHVERVSLVYREEYFDGERLHRLRDEVVLEVPIDASAAAEVCRPEPTPKELDDMLLRHANGKLIDLPRFGSGYVHRDDGKAQEVPGVAGAVR